MPTTMQLLVCVFDDTVAADQARKAIQALDKQVDTIRLGNIAVLKKDREGKLTFRETEFLARMTSSPVRGAVEGTLLGVVCGALAPFLGPAAPALGTEMEILIDRLPWTRKDLGFPDETLAELGQRLDAGHSALVMLVRPEEVEVVTANLQHLGGHLIQQTLSADLLAELMAAARLVRGDSS